MNTVSPLDYTRQLDLANPARLAAVHIDLVGLGGIGSPTGLALAKMGCTDLRAIDMDRVEPVNLNTQLYRLQDAAAGAWKAEACRDIWHQFAGIEASTCVARAEEVALHGIVVTGVDSMAARQAIWERLLDSPAVEWLIDGRMGAMNGMVLSARLNRPSDRRAYERSLYEDGAVTALPCTGRAIVFNTLWIAALVARQVIRIVKEQPLERRIEFDLEGLSLLVVE